MELLQQQTKSSQKQVHSILRTMYICIHQATLPTHIKCLVLLVNIILNLTVFLSMPNVAIIQINHILSSLPLVLTLLVLYLILLFEVYLCYEYKIQLFFCAQLDIFRNVLSPLLMSCLLQGISSDSRLPKEVCILMVVFYYFGMCFMINCFQSQKQKASIKAKGLTKSFYRFQSQTLLYCICTNIQSSTLVIGSIVFLTVCFVQFRQLFSVKSNQNNLRAKFQSISVIIFLFYGLILVIGSVGGLKIDQTKYIIYSLIILLGYSLALMLLQKPRPVDYKDIVQLLQIQTKDAKIQDAQKYIDIMESIAQNLNSILHQNRFDKIMQNELTQFWIQHQKYCKNIKCIQQGQKINLHQLINNNDIGLLNLKSYFSEVIERIMKSIYYIDPTNVKILLSILRFYTVCMPSRQKSLQLISQISIFQQNLNFFQRYSYYQSKELFDNIISEQLSGQLKYDKQLFQFGNYKFYLESIIYLMTNAISQFWVNFLEQKVNLDRLIQLNSKIQPYRQRIEKLVKYMIKRDNFSTLKMYQVYSQFCQIIQNNKVKSKIFHSLQEQTKKVLQQRKQLQFRKYIQNLVSYDSQIGIVAISLSENSLGQIRMINTQANMIFGYPQDQLKGKRVNQIMSSIHSQNHDDILSAFLLNYKKAINTNQRYLFGKNKAGYIFPLYLQLQKTCGDNMKQLTFIANIQKVPTKSSVVACIIDEQGQIKQVSSMFKNIFFFSKHNTVEPIGKNIQEVVNDFFCLGSPLEISERIIKVQHKYYGKIDLGVQIQGLSFPKKKLAGYTINFPILTSLDKPRTSFNNITQISMTKQLIQNQRNDNLSGYQMRYNSFKNVYQLLTNAKKLNSPSRDIFTLPYINMNDMGKAFLPKDQIEQTTKPIHDGIRTIRLRNGHFQRAEDEISFYSQQDREKRQKNQLKQNLDLIKDKHEQNGLQFIYFGKICYFAIFIVLLVLTIVKFNGQLNYSQDNQSFMFKMQEKYRVRKHLAQYVTTYQLLNLDPTNQYLSEALLNSHQDLIDTIYQSQIEEIQKQNILKIDFLQLGANLTYFFQTGLVSFDYTYPQEIVQVKKTSNILMAMIAVEILLAILIYFYYVRKLESTFESLLIIDDKIIKQTIQKCAELSKNIQHSIKTICQAYDQNNSSTNQPEYAALGQEEQDNQNPIKTSKKSISKQKITNIPKLLCFLVPALLFLCYNIFDRLILQKEQAEFVQRAKIFQIIYETQPQSNIALMNTVLQYSYTQKMAIVTQFTEIYQILDKNIKKFQKSYSNYIGQSLFRFYLQNVCSHPRIQINESQCGQIEQGILKYGLSPTLNTFANKITNLQNSSGNNSISDKKLGILVNLFTLQNQFVLQIIQNIATSLYIKILQETTLLETDRSSIFYIAIFLLLVKLLYVFIYPFQIITTELSTSSQLKNIIPSDQNGSSQQLNHDSKYQNVEKQLFSDI